MSSVVGCWELHHSAYYIIGKTMIMERSVLLKLFHLSFLVLLASLGSAQQSVEPSYNSTLDVGRVASRRKRFIGFPKGSSLQMVYCFLTTAYGTYGGLFTIGITLGLAWEIPQDPRPFLEQATMGHIQRRHRRDLFPKIESFLDKYGVIGRSCILRAICESRQHPKGNGTFIEEIIHSLFSFPLLEDSWEDSWNDSTSVYDEAHQADSCHGFNTDCPYSILDLDISGRTPDRTSSDVT